MGLVQLLGDARRILVFTGAGISTGSGIRDFRGPKGVWKERQPVYFDDFMNSEVARIEHWDQKCQTWPSFRDAEPNAVHTSVADLERTSSRWSSRRTSTGSTPAAGPPPGGLSNCMVRTRPSSA